MLSMERNGVVDPTESPQAESDTDGDQTTELPTGNHPLEVAARKGFGPLSKAIDKAWHGEAIPCVSCGQLVRRTQNTCDECEQDLSARMIEKMRTHSGPWYVLEHLRPFPGVTLDRIIRQIRRGLITETSIIRGPSTDHQWRFAVETPGLCRYFGQCWKCHSEVAPSDSTCTRCRALLTYEQHEEPGHPASGDAAASHDRVLMPTSHLTALSDAVGRAGVSKAGSEWNSTPRVGGIRVTWIAGFLVVAVITLLVWISSLRQNRTSESPPPAESMVVPATTTEATT